MTDGGDRSELELLGGKVVGRRKVRQPGPEDMARLVRTVVALRGTRAVVPRGVYRFRSFEEADAWMTEMMQKTHAHRSRRTSAGSARR